MLLSFFRRTLLLLAVLLAPAASAQQQTPLRIAAAADLATCVDRLNAASGTGASATIGASGSFYAQISHGAPYDVFLSADTAYPRALADAGLADPASLFVYAHGRLALWAGTPGVEVDKGLRLLLDGVIALGPGKAALLRGIQDSGSISAAARAMSMSYRRAWLLVEDMNRCFRQPLVETSTGGARGGGARLTDNGRDVLARYAAMEQAALAAVQADMDYLAALLADTPSD